MLSVRQRHDVHGDKYCGKHSRIECLLRLVVGDLRTQVDQSHQLSSFSRCPKDKQLVRLARVAGMVFWMWSMRPLQSCLSHKDAGRSLSHRPPCVLKSRMQISHLYCTSR